MTFGIGRAFLNALWQASGQSVGILPFYHVTTFPVPLKLTVTGSSFCTGLCMTGVFVPEACTACAGRAILDDLETAYASGMTWGVIFCNKTATH